MKSFFSFSLLLLVLALSASKWAHSQETDSSYRMTLSEAQEFALQNSPVIKNSALDLESAKKKIWETTAIGLPQVNGKFSYSYMLTVPSEIEQFSSLSQLGSWMYLVDQTLYNMQGQDPQSPFGHIPMPDTTAQSDEDDLKWSMTLDITVTQIIFSGAYLVGLQTSRVYKGLSEVAVTKSINDLKESVANTYMLVLIADENVAILDSTYKNTEKLYADIKEFLNQGLVEDTDADQLELTLNTIKNSLDMLKKQAEIARKLLKYQIGMDLYAELELEDSLNKMIEDEIIAKTLLQEFQVKQQPEFMLMDYQEKLMSLNVKLNRSAYLPDVAAYYQHQENFNDNSFSFTPPDIVGVGVNIPIWSSGMRHARLQQAKIGLEKAENNKYQVEQGLLLDYEQSKATLTNAYNQYKTQKESEALSRKIYEKTIIKYKEGVSSSLELTQAQNQYLSAQSSYYNALLELINAKTKMNKLLQNEIK